MKRRDNARARAHSAPPGPDSPTPDVIGRPSCTAGTATDVYRSGASGDSDIGERLVGNHAPTAHDIQCAAATVADTIIVPGLLSNSELPVPPPTVTMLPPAIGPLQICTPFSPKSSTDDPSVIERLPGAVLPTMRFCVIQGSSVPL